MGTGRADFYRGRIHAKGFMVLPLLLFMAVCSRTSDKKLSAESFARWFTGTDNEITAGLLSASQLHIDSLVSRIRNGGPAGTGRTDLSDTGGSRFTVGFSTPRTMEQDTLYPCIIYLHGGVGTLRSDKGADAWMMLQMLSDSMELFLASPSANRTAPWWSPAGLSRILQTLRYMSLHYPVNPRKVFLAGVSDGATGCWAAANTIASPFAGFMAVSGFGGMLPRLGMKLYPQNLMQRPLYVVHSGKDHLYPITAVNGFLNQLESAGVGILRKEYPDEQHGFDYRRKEAGTLCSLVTTWTLPEPGACNWLFSSAWPRTIAGVVSAVPENGATSFSVSRYCRGDTVVIRSDGIKNMTLFFETNNSCAQKAIFRINDTNCHRYTALTSVQEARLLQMRQRCFPIVPDGIFFRLPL